jgi:hypothetical protein
VACVKGKYGDQLARVQASDCTNCVAGKYNDVLGIADASSCKDCPQGYVGGGGGGGVVWCCLLLFVVVCCCLLLFVVSDLFFLCTLCYSLLLSLSSFFFRCVFWFLCRLAGNTVRKIVWLPKETTIFVLVCPVLVVDTAPNPVSTTPEIAPIAPLANI